MNSGPVRGRQIVQCKQSPMPDFSAFVNPGNCVSEPDAHEYTFGAGRPNERFRGGDVLGDERWKPVFADRVWKKY